MSSLGTRIVVDLGLNISTSAVTHVLFLLPGVRELLSSNVRMVMFVLLRKVRQHAQKEGGWCNVESRFDMHGLLKATCGVVTVGVIIINLLRKFFVVLCHALSGRENGRSLCIATGFKIP